MKRLHKTDKGFTLIELLVGLSIAAFVVSAIAMTVTTMMRLAPENTRWAVALRQVQDAGYWISRDVVESQGDIGIDSQPDTFLALVVPYENAGTVATKTVDYRFEDLSGTQWLTRNDSVDGKMVVAQLISNTDANYNSDNYTLTFTIEATSGDVVVNRQYAATQRIPAP